MPLPNKLASATNNGELKAVCFEKCWAKTTDNKNPGISVLEHCLNVGCVAEALMKFLPRQLLELLPDGIATLAALHDIGKVSPGFQAKCRAWIHREQLDRQAICENWYNKEPDHSKISQFMIQKMLSEANLHIWAATVGAHHGRIKGERINICDSAWENECKKLASKLIKTFGELPTVEAEDDTLIWFAAGLISVADWIGSDEDTFQQDIRRTLKQRRTKAHKALKSLGWGKASMAPNLSFNSLFPNLVSPNPFQLIAKDTVTKPGLYILEAPMGFGKTEAALLIAHRLISSGIANGIYFALPTQITSNRIYSRMQQFLEHANVNPATLRLAHSNSWLFEQSQLPRINPTVQDDESRKYVIESRSWFASAKRALLAPYGVGTIDQTLLSIVAAKHFFVRQFGLAGKVVVLDEVHSYDLYTSTLIEELIRILLKLQSTVIVLSATLTRERRRRLLSLDGNQPLCEAYPLISGRADNFIEVACPSPPQKRVDIIFHDDDKLPLKALKEASHGKCVLWIRNTVDEAQETFQLLSSINRESGPQIGIIHSRFPFFRRNQLENFWMEALGKNVAKRPSGCVLVATQVAEQSVDIDADLLITDIAPTDMILQRIGRLWRHKRPNRKGKPEVWIREISLTVNDLQHASERELREALGKSAKVYAPYILLRTIQQWRHQSSLVLPSGIRQILEATYKEPSSDEPESWKRLRKQLEEKKNALEAIALTNTNVWTSPALRDEEGIQTRYNTYPMAQLLLARDLMCKGSQTSCIKLLNGDLVVANEHKWNVETARAINRNLVKVPFWTISSFVADAPKWLKNYIPNSANIGFLHDSGEIYTLCKSAMGLSYHADRGIIIHKEKLTGEAGESNEYFD